MFKNKKVISALLSLVILSLCGCSTIGMVYHLILNNKLVESGEVEINLDGGRKVSLEIKKIYGKAIFSGMITTKLRLVRKPEDIEYQYNEETGQFIIKDEGKTLIGIPKIDVTEIDGEKSYLVHSSSLINIGNPSKELLRMTFKVGKIIPPSFQFIIEEKETKRPLCNVQVQAKNWEKYRKYIKDEGYFRYYPKNDLQISLLDGEKIGTEFTILVGGSKRDKFMIFMRLHFTDPIRESYKILFKKAYVQDESKNLYKASAYVYGSNYGAQLIFSKILKPPKEFSLFIPYTLKESSEESVIKIDFKVDEEELEEFLKVVESKEVPEPWKSNWFSEK